MLLYSSICCNHCLKAFSFRLTFGVMTSSKNFTKFRKISQEFRNFCRTPKAWGLPLKIERHATSVLSVWWSIFFYVNSWIRDFCPNQSGRFLFLVPEGPVHWLFPLKLRFRFFYVYIFAPVLLLQLWFGVRILEDPIENIQKESATKDVWRHWTILMSKRTTK